MVAYDKIISLYQGRPVSFDESRLRIPHRFLDWYEEQELWTPYAFPGIQGYPGAPARAISTFTSYCSLSVVMVSQIVQSATDLTGPNHHSDIRREILTKSSGWPFSETIKEPRRLDDNHATGDSL
jgi:hypothetical protein